MRRHLDSGGVQVEVTSITNGSVVVEFNLLLLADVDVREVSAAFLTAFQNASVLEVVRGDTFIWGRRGPSPEGDSRCFRTRGSQNSAPAFRLLPCASS